MLQSHEIEGLRRSHVMAPLPPDAVSQLLETCEQLTRERIEIARLLAELPESFGALRSALNRLHKLVS